ncbi:hypothetical protein D1012_13015 [Pseudotabrizicola alkalilacus]|uniref:Uncharacterized protein n=2 Tax=Pseudotabrizicola alkalilacus TaxID=2305252 RepID=A0A411Z0J2_9RHOB|nr:hypothetical protein D1012_13015 [Pseudotabrizicola alkalilacus]
MDCQMMPFARPRRRPLLALLTLLCLGVAACAPLPDIAQTVDAPPPVLVPLAGILAQADAVGTSAAAVAPVTARADRLRARADQLRSQ